MSAEGREDSAVADRSLLTRLQKALSANSEEIFAWVQDPSREVLQALLRNPALQEPHLLALLKRGELGEDLLKKVADHELVKSSYRLKLALAQHADCPAHQRLQLLPLLRLFDLPAISRLPETGPDLRMAAEQQLIRRLPTTALGNRISLARRATSAVLSELLKDKNPGILEACLSSSRLKEMSLVQYLRTGYPGEAAIRLIASHDRWRSRPSVIRALVNNRRTPAPVLIRFLPQLPSSELGNLERIHTDSLCQNLIRTEKRRRGL